MTNKEIKAKGLEHMQGKWGTTVALTVFQTSLILAMVVFELLIYMIFRHLGIEYDYSVSYVFGTHFGRFMLTLRLLVILFVYNPEMYILNRIFVDMFTGRNFIETRQFIRHNSRAIHPRATFSRMVPMLLKLFALVPLGVSVYGIYFWGFRNRSESLTTLGLFIFMISIGFTIVWAGVFVHYCISLSMTEYIMLLNPRASIFDACDLSVRIMDGNHSRYLSFVLSFVRYLPSLLLFYPIYLLEPYYKMCKCVLAQEIMGQYWQDKYPQMIQRWNKYAR